MVQDHGEFQRHLECMKRFRSWHDAAFPAGKGYVSPARTAGDYTAGEKAVTTMPVVLMGRPCLPREAVN